MRVEQQDLANLNGVKFFAGVIAGLFLAGAAALVLTVLVGVHPSSAAQASLKVTEQEVKPPTDNQYPFYAKYNSVNGVLTIGGDYDDSGDISKIVTALDGKIPKGVILENSHGGAVSVGFYIGENVIFKNKIPVMAKGYCDSSCAYAWMGALTYDSEYQVKDVVMLQHMPFDQAGNSGDEELAMVAGYFARVDIQPKLAVYFKYAAYSAGYIDNNYLPSGVPNGVFDLTKFYTDAKVSIGTEAEFLTRISVKEMVK